MPRKCYQQPCLGCRRFSNFKLSTSEIYGLVWGIKEAANYLVQQGLQVNMKTLLGVRAHVGLKIHSIDVSKSLIQ